MAHNYLLTLLSLCSCACSCLFGCSFVSRCCDCVVLCCAGVSCCSGLLLWLKFSPLPWHQSAGRRRDFPLYTKALLKPLNLHVHAGSLPALHRILLRPVSVRPLDLPALLAGRSRLLLLPHRRPLCAMIWRWYVTFAVEGPRLPWTGPTPMVWAR